MCQCLIFEKSPSQGTLLTVEVKEFLERYFKGILAPLISQ